LPTASDPPLAAADVKGTVPADAEGRFVTVAGLAGTDGTLALFTGNAGAAGVAIAVVTAGVDTVVVTSGVVTGAVTTGVDTVALITVVVAGDDAVGTVTIGAEMVAVATGVETVTGELSVGSTDEALGPLGSPPARPAVASPPQPHATRPNRHTTLRRSTPIFINAPRRHEQ
jgi:hypothetical protein